jgi:RNA polymerase sigma-70 factor (ECF subfamily)
VETPGEPVPADVARRWTLVSEHRDRLLRIARARVRPADADDVVQEAMLRCVEYPLLDESRVGALLTTLTMRLCVDLHRTRIRELRAGTAVLHREVAEPGPEESVCDRAEAEWVSGIAATLPPRQREALALRAEGVAVAEAAHAMHLSYKAFESTLSRARRSLRSHLLAAGCTARRTGSRTR